MAKYLTLDGLTKFYEGLKGKFAGKTHSHAVSEVTNLQTNLDGKEALIKNAAAKTTLVDADTLPLTDSAASSATKKITWANIKTVLKTYFDTIYSVSGHTHNYAGSSSAGGAATSAEKLSAAKSFSLTGDATGSVSADLSNGAAIPVTLANSGATAGTYKSVTVDAKGRVTSGTNPTTLAGYGITDAATKTELSATEAIAKGASRALVFDTSAQLDSWLAGTYTRSDGKKKADLIIGDNLYIKATNVPDYWWDGTQKQELETAKVDLTDYLTNSDVTAITNAEIDAILAS